jgi:site-specific DNA-methyltransferase (adenine-specific)/adenine-specific DNA-methyltransferase
LDEVFGRPNFVSAIIWQKVYSPKNSAKHFSTDHDYILVYAKNSHAWRPKLVTRSEAQDAAYKNRDHDPRGPWKTGDLSARNYYSLGTYEITCPSGRAIPNPPRGMYWRVSEEKFFELDADKRIWWGQNGNSKPQIKRFLSEVKQGVVPQTLWFYKDAGHTQDAKKELLKILDFPDSESVFITPKPTKLIQRILHIATDRNSIILDSFAGSGTTGHAVLQLNKQDGGNRRFILVEMDSNICRNVTVERLRRVCVGHTKPDGTAVEGLGGGFRYATLGEPLFDERGNIRATVPFVDLARHVYFTETGEPLPKQTEMTGPLIGVCRGTGIYLLFNGILKDKSPGGGNVLTTAVLAQLPKHDGPKVIYGTACRMGAERLRSENIVFKQLPYKLRVDAL